MLYQYVGEDDDIESREEEKEELKSYSRRKIFSNWSRYEDTEKEGQSEHGESQRGTDFSVLLSSAEDALFAFFIVTFLMPKEVYQSGYNGKQHFCPAFFTDGILQLCFSKLYLNMKKEEEGEKEGGVEISEKNNLVT
ncbi:cell death regulator aven [Limosa lapponica baueri]|uniref:Cell death regulator aven n=1 Tax=Limosa lapponica baueri TaxID=1758121 RepID=A0A2I0UJT4_LIMLA|nr:cell death regulator aven [Limosa lapponica baueri]